MARYSRNPMTPKSAIVICTALWIEPGYVRFVFITSLANAFYVRTLRLGKLAGLADVNVKSDDFYKDAQKTLKFWDLCSFLRVSSGTEIFLWGWFWMIAWRQGLCNREPGVGTNDLCTLSMGSLWHWSSGWFKWDHLEPWFLTHFWCIFCGQNWGVCLPSSASQASKWGSKDYDNWISHKKIS